MKRYKWFRGISLQNLKYTKLTCDEPTNKVREANGNDRTCHTYKSLWDPENGVEIARPH